MAKKKISGLEAFQPRTSAELALSSFFEFLDGYNPKSADVQKISSFGRVRVLRYDFPENEGAAPLFVVEFRLAVAEDNAPPRRWGGLPSIDSGVSSFIRREIVRFERSEFFLIPDFVRSGRKPGENGGF